MRLILFLTLIALVPFSSAYAQFESPPISAEERAQILEMLPDEFVEESMIAYDNCTKDVVQSAYFDCECLSSALLEERIKAGPESSTSALILRLNKRCRDATGAAGKVYNDCLSMHGRMKPGTDPEKYCECVANDYARAFNQLAPYVNSANMVNIQSMAYSGCERPDRGESPIELMIKNQPN